MSLFKRKKDTTWIYKYDLEDFVCEVSMPYNMMESLVTGLLKMVITY